MSSEQPDRVGAGVGEEGQPQWLYFFAIAATSPSDVGSPVFNPTVGKELPNVFKMSSASRSKSQINRWRPRRRFGMVSAMGHHSDLTTSLWFGEEGGEGV